MKNTLTHKKNSTHVVKIEDMTNLGSGVAHLDGAAVFVNGAVDGDECEIKIIKVASGYYAARIERIITPSQHRTIPDCPVSGRCGGCVYRHLKYGDELVSKHNRVLQAFRQAGLGDVVVRPVLSTGVTRGYRNKGMYPVRAGKAGMEAGFFAAKSHKLIPCSDCSLQPDIFGEIVRFIYQRNAEGMSMVAITDALAKAGYVTRKKSHFQVSTIKSILSNRPLYEGMYKYGKNMDWVQGVHEPILAPDEFLVA